MKRAGARTVPTSDEELENSLSSYTEKTATQKTPEKEVLEDEVRQTLLRRCKELKPPYDEIARMYYYEEIEMPEIAKMKNLNLKTVQTQVYRARAMLRKQYRKEDFLR